MGVVALIGAVVGAIASCAAGLVKGLAVIGMAVEGIKAIGGVFIGIGKALGIIEDKDMEVDELGDKAIQSGLKPDDFDSYSAYVDAVQHYKTDPEKSAQISEEDKVKKGTEVAAGISIEKFGKEFDFNMMEELINNKNFMTGKDYGNLVNLIENLPSTPKEACAAGKFTLDKEQSKSDALSGVEFLVNIEKKNNPGISNEEALRNVYGMKK